MIKVEGYSGCGIDVFRNDSGEYILEKSTDDPSYVPRLLKQVDKQIAFNKMNKVRSVVSPKILYRRTAATESLDDNEEPKNTVASSAAIGMRFEHHTDCITFLQKADVFSVQRFSAMLIDVLEQYVDASPLQHVKQEIFVNKLNDIERIVNKNTTIPASMKETIVETIIPKLLQSVHSEGVCVPVGICHGDLTLSNILIRGDAAPTASTPDEELRKRAVASSGGEWVILIDFLDNFVESPLADLAKLFQDLRYGWTLKLHSHSNFDTLKVFAVLGSIERTVLGHFQEHEWFKRYFLFFFVINQLRVLQYCKSLEIADYLFRTIEESFAEWCEKHQEML